MLLSLRNERSSLLEADFEGKVSMINRITFMFMISPDEWDPSYETMYDEIVENAVLDGIDMPSKRE